MYSRHSRRKSNHCALYHIALALTMIAVCVSADAENAATLDDTARLLAGLPVTGQPASFTQTGGWQAHAAAMDKAWKTKEYFQLGPIASWMGSHAGEYYHSSATMYYMFSGPDFLYAYAFFPNASTYILGGPRTSRPGARSDANESGNAEFQSCRIAQLDEHAPKNALFRDRGNENRARAQQSQWNGSYSLCFFGATWLHCAGYNFRP
jgi:hypothetical protein